MPGGPGHRAGGGGGRGPGVLPRPPVADPGLTLGRLPRLRLPRPPGFRGVFLPRPPEFASSDFELLDGATAATLLMRGGVLAACALARGTRSARRPVPRWSVRCMVSSCGD